MEPFLIMHASLQDCFSRIICNLYSRIGYFVLNELFLVYGCWKLFTRCASVPCNSWEKGHGTCV